MTRVLIVDDEPESRTRLRTLLQAHGHAVIEASNGLDALELARQQPPDLVVSDILMPVIGLGIPGGTWRDAKFVLRQNPDGSLASINYGVFMGAIVDFVIIGFVVFMLTKLLLKPAPAAPAPPTKVCPECRETIPADARKCRACASAV